MALTFSELQSVTDDYYKTDGGKAFDIYFDTSFFMDKFLNKKFGIYDKVDTMNVKIPLEYDMSEGGFYARGGAISSDDKATINAAKFALKNAYGNATIFDTDELANSGSHGKVKLIVQKVSNAQKTIAKKIAQQIYSSSTDGASEISGLLAMCFGGTSTAYGQITPTDLVSTDGSTPWASVNTTTTEGISLDVIRTLATSAKIYDGPKGKPDIGLTTEALFNIIAGRLQVQQRFQPDTDTAKAGFTNLVFEQKIIAADDYCPSGYLFLLNSNFVGWAVHKDGLFTRTPWADLITANVFAKSMKVKFHGNIVCSNRKAQAGHSNLS